MGLFDLFKTKKDKKENIAVNTFVCDVCKRTLQVSCRHHANVCASCANATSINYTFTCRKCGKKLPLNQRSYSYICISCAYEEEKEKLTKKEKAEKQPDLNIDTTTDQPQTFVCARCKKEITGDEFKWINNHRFCMSCYGSKNTTIGGSVTSLRLYYISSNYRGGSANYRIVLTKNGQTINIECEYNDSNYYDDRFESRTGRHSMNLSEARRYSAEELAYMLCQIFYYRFEPNGCVDNLTLKRWLSQ